MAHKKCEGIIKAMAHTKT